MLISSPQVHFQYLTLVKSAVPSENVFVPAIIVATMTALR